MFIKCFTCKNPLYDHIHGICVNIFYLCNDKYFYGKCSFIIIFYVKIFLSQSVPPLLIISLYDHHYSVSVNLF